MPVDTNSRPTRFCTDGFDVARLVTVRSISSVRTKGMMRQCAGKGLEASTNRSSEAVLLLLVEESANARVPMGNAAAKESPYWL